MKRLILTILVILTACVTCVCACNKSKTRNAALREHTTAAQNEENGKEETPERPDDCGDECPDGHCGNGKFGRRFPEFIFYIDFGDMGGGGRHAIEGFFKPRYPHCKNPVPCPDPAPDPDPDLTQPEN